MSVIEITAEKLSAMSPRQRDLFVEMFPEKKDFVLDWEMARYQGDKDFSNQMFFTLADGSIVSKAVLEMLAYSSLGGKKDDREQSEHGEVKRAAWDSLHAIQFGKKLQGEVYNLTPDGFKARVGVK